MIVVLLRLPYLDVPELHEEGFYEVVEETEWNCCAVSDSVTNLLKSVVRNAVTID